MSLSTDPGSAASSTSRRCCMLLADAGFSHMPASKRDIVILEACRTQTAHACNTAQEQIKQADTMTSAARAGDQETCKREQLMLG